MLTTQPTTQTKRGRPAVSFDDVFERLKTARGPGWKTGDLVVLTGFSKMKVLAEIAADMIHGNKVSCGTRFEYVFSHAEVRRYVLDIGLFTAAELGLARGN